MDRYLIIVQLDIRIELVYIKSAPGKADNIRGSRHDTEVKDIRKNILSSSPQA